MGNENSRRDPFFELKDTLDKDLSSQGFDPDKSPPGKEPRIRTKLSAKTSVQLRDLYDEFLGYYGYLTDVITRCVVFKDITKGRLVSEKARVTLAATKTATLKNAEARKAWVDCHPDVNAATCEYLYFKEMYEATEERRRKLSKSMDRIYRELLLREENSHASRSTPPSRGSSRFRPTR